MRYANLHHHSIYSVLDGHATIRDYVDRLDRLGHSHAAVTDHGTMAGLPAFFAAMQARDKVPIAGLETYFTPHDMRLKDADHRKSYHLTLLARDETGFRNLIQLSSIAAVEGIYYRPRIDLPTLAAHSAGVTCLSGCLAGIIPQLLLAGDEERALDWIEAFHDVFGPHFWLEFQNHGDDIPDQIAVNRALARIARKYDLRVAATNDSHFCAAADHHAHHTLLKIKGAGEVYSSAHAYLRSDAAMVRAFGDGALLKNTLEIAHSCVPYAIGDPDPKLPVSPLEVPGVPVARTFTDLVWQGLVARMGVAGFSDLPFAYIGRAQHEIAVIASMGFARYLLIIADLVAFARRRGIRFGARGSAAGSICCWALGISELDPIAYGLYFERFLNPERVSMPDIDMDFADDRRDEVLSYLQQTYGERNVARIGTYARIGAKSALRDAARMVRADLSRDYLTVGDELAALIPRSQHEVLLEEVLADPDSPLNHRIAADPEAAAVTEAATQIAGRLRGVGLHAAGIVVSDRPLDGVVPLARTTNHKTDVLKIQTQWEDDWLEEIGLLKLDVLGLSELAKIELAVRLVGEMTGQVPDLATVDLADPAVWEIFASGDTLGLFQIGGREITGAITALRPASLDELALLLAIYRPGPVQNLSTIIARKHRRERVTSIHPDLDAVLAPTYGIPVYQEQIIEIVVRVAGYTRGKADLVRKAMGKKLPEELAKHRAGFLAGAVANGYAEADAARIWSYIEPFAGYGFNKAHACAYALISFQSAWLKAHYPQAFYLASLTVETRTNGKAGESAQDRIGAFVAEAGRRGIAVLPPSIDCPTVDFAPEGPAAIRYGLGAVKELGRKTAQAVAAAAPYPDLAALVTRTPGLSRDAYRVLARAGALDRFGNRAQVLETLDYLVDARRLKTVAQRVRESKEEARQRGEQRMSAELAQRAAAVASGGWTPQQPPSGWLEHVEWELHHTGVIWSGFPPQQGMPIAETGYFIGQPVTVTGVITMLDPFLSRARKLQMARGSLLDASGKIDLLFWPGSWEQVSGWIRPGSYVRISGVVDIQQDPGSQGVSQAVGLLDAGEAPPPSLLKIKVEACENESAAIPN